MLKNIFTGRNYFRRFPFTNSKSPSSHLHNAPHSKEPVKFSASKASEWKASYSRSGIEGDSETAWFQPFLVTGSIAVFLLYFCVLREENDIDELLGASLYDRIDGLEEAQLRRLLAYNIEHNKETKDISARIKELEDLRKVKSKF